MATTILYLWFQVRVITIIKGSKLIYFIIYIFTSGLLVNHDFEQDII